MTWVSPPANSSSADAGGGPGESPGTSGTSLAGVNIPRIVIHRIAIIGAGAQGSGLAVLAARHGYSVTLEDLLPSTLRQAAARIDSLLGNASTISYARSVEEAAREADLVIDFVPDELESKLEIFSLLDRMAPPRTIFATPTSTLSIADLASCTYRPDRCVGLRFDGDFPKAVAAGEQGSHEDQDSRLTDPSADFQVEIAHASQVIAPVLQALDVFWQKLGARVAFSVDRVALP